ncbi:MAG: putative glycoside hydrolase [Proteobacteria bacterium]|nr:putative glycoside hydrolase [Pseudomonadota bacterium]
MTQHNITRLTMLLRSLCAGLVLNGCAGVGRDAIADSPTELRDWPKLGSAISRNPDVEARIARIVAGMSLAQKIGQMTQPEIKSVTPAQVRQFYIGSVLNGGGSWPNKNKHASAADWVELADQYYDASMTTDMKVKVPVIWGIDAIHGNSNVYGATLFPHNIGLGAAHDAVLVGKIGAAVGKAVRATGIHWVFAPTLAVARDDRWGRTYESFSEDGALVHAYAGAYVTGLQGSFADDANVVATAKHFIGDGGTDLGKDQGINQSGKAEMINIHGQGYYGALAAGVQTVMASFNSWNDVAAGKNYGKMHGSRELLTEVLKTRMGFDGFVVSDWNGIAQVPGCKDASCPQAINAGVDMVMVPDDWRAFIANTIAEVETGKIPLARIDDAVTRILRVKMRAGLFDKKPSQGAYAGRQEALQARALARVAVQESLVLLKNNGGVLPLARGKKILVVGKSADSMQNQAGGWSLTWQGTENKNSDFPNGDTILAGIREATGAANVTYSETARGVDPGAFDAVIAVIGETPYAEGAGDISPPGTLRHSSRYPEDLAVLSAVAGKGKPVVSVFVSGRALYTNDLMNLSDAFVAAWLPGTEGKGIADVLFRNAGGGVNRDFRGSLAFSWPQSACQTPLNFGDAGYSPLFPLGYGLKYASAAVIGTLDTRVATSGCGGASAVSIFNQTERAPYALYVSSAANNWIETAVGGDLNATLNLPATQPVIRVQTTQINTQQDAKLVTWFGQAQIYLRSGRKEDLQAFAAANGALQFDTLISQLPQGSVTMAMDCGYPCRGTLDLTNAFKRIGTGAKRSVKIPLACFAVKGTDLANVDTPFNVQTAGQFSAAFADIKIVAGAAMDADALSCGDIGVAPK